jgi:hypothetical protein
MLSLEVLDPVSGSQLFEPRLRLGVFEPMDNIKNKTQIRIRKSNFIKGLFKKCSLIKFLTEEIQKNFFSGLKKSIAMFYVLMHNFF